MGFQLRYPDEPKANSKATVSLSEDGKTLDGETVVEKSQLAGNTLKIVTEIAGRDADKKALFRFTYLYNATSFAITKEVRCDDAKGFFQRNQYTWNR